MTKLYLLLLLLVLSLPGRVIAQTYATSQANGVTGLCLLCGVSNPNNAVNNSNLTDYSTFNITAGLLGVSVYQTLIFPAASGACDSLVITIGSSNTALSVNLLGGITVQTFNGATANNDLRTIDSSNVRFLENNTVAQIMLHPGQTFDRAQLSLKSSTLGLLSGLRVYYAYKNPGAPATPVFTTPQGFVCGPQTLLIQNYMPGIEYKVNTVYRNLFGNTLLDTSFTIINSSNIPVRPYFNFSYTQTEVYIAAHNPFTGCTSDTAHQVLYFGGAGALAVVDEDTVTICKGQQATLHAYVPNNNQANILWYSQPAGGTALYNGTDYTVSPDTTTTYYVTSGFECEYPQRVPVTVIVTKLPTPALTVPVGTQCGNVSLPVTNHQPGINYHVKVRYDENFGPLTDTSYDISGQSSIPVNDNIGYRITYALVTVQAFDAAGCLSDSIQYPLYFGGHAAYPSTDTDLVNICAGDSATLHAFIPGTNTPQIRWYSTASGGTPLATGPFYQVSPGATTTYYVTSAFACEYPFRRPVTVTVTDCSALMKSSAHIAALTVYPNPTAGAIRISGVADLVGARLFVYDAQGATVKATVLSNNVFHLECKTGIYLIKVITAKGKVHTGKVIVK